MPGPPLCCSGSCRASPCSRAPPAWLGLGPSAAVLLERSQESHPLPHPLPRPRCPSRSLPSPRTGAGGHPPRLDPLPGTESHPLPRGFGSAGAQCFAAPALAHPAMPGQTPQNLPPTSPWDVPLGCIVHQRGGTGDTVLSRGSERWEGARTPADAPGGSPGPVQGSDLVWRGVLRWHLCLLTPPATFSSGSWQALGPWAGSPGFLSPGLVGARWARSALPAQRAGVLPVL